MRRRGGRATRGGIGIRLALLALGAALPLTIGLVTIVLVSRDLARDDADRRVQATATATADSLAGYLSRIAARLAEGAGRDDVRALRATSCAGFGRGFVAALPQAVSIVLVGPDGAPVCSTTAGLPPVGDASAVDAVIAGAPSAVGDPSTTGSELPYATIVARVDAARGTGALVLGLGLERLGTQLGASPPSEDGSLGAITPDGTLVARVPPPPGEALGSTFPQYRDLDRRGHVAEARGIDGVKRIFSAAPVRGTPWIAFAAVASDDAYAIPDRILRVGLVFVIGALLVAGGLALLVAGALRRRIRAVADAATRLGALERGVRVPVTGPTEVAEVADSFNRMAASWEEARDELQHLRQIDAAIITAGSTTQATAAVAAWLLELVGVDRVAVLTLDAEQGELVVDAVAGAWGEAWPVGFRVRLDGLGALPERWQAGAVYLRDLGEEPDQLWARSIEPPVRSALHVPLRVESRLVGIVSAASARPDGVPVALHRHVEEIAGHLAIVIDRGASAAARERLTERLQTLLDLDRAILAAGSLREVAAVGVEAIARDEHLLRASVGRYDVETRTAELLAVSGAVGEGTGVGAHFEITHQIDLEALARGETVVLSDIAALESSPFLDRLVRTGVHSIVFVPLRDRGELLGVMHLSSGPGHAVPAAVVERAREIAGQISIAWRQTLLLERERVARAAMQETLVELSGLQEVSDTSLARLPPDELVARLLPRVCSLMDADCARLLLADDEETRLRVSASYGLDESVEGEVEMPFGEGVAGRVAAERRLLFFVADDLREAFSPAVRERVRAMVGAPLLFGDEVLGVLDVGRYDDRPFGEPDRRLFTVAVDRLAGAVARARREERLERAVAARTAELTTANDELDAFAYSLSHDLRAPLRAMRGFSTAILEDHGDVLPDEGRDFARRIVGAVGRMEELIDDLLAYSRLSRARLPEARVRLDDVVRDAVAGLRSRPDVAAAHIEVGVGLGEVRAHAATLTMAVSNLVDNAVKYVRPGEVPRVRIRAEPVGQAIRLWVEDTGIGIAAEHHERIYRVFERLHGREAYDGTGVGLASVRKGVERMNGTTGVESAPGVGSRFWIELPAWGRS